MQTTPPWPPPAPSRAKRAGAGGLVTRGQSAAIATSIALVAFIGFTAKACESFEGGPVRSASAFRLHIENTKQAGEDAYAQLSPASLTAPYAEKEDSTSCVDDFGFDEEGVTRDRPIYTWSPPFTSRADYRTVVANLKAAWQSQGRKVTDVRAPAKGEPGKGLPGITTKDDHGTELSLQPAYYSGNPEIRAEGTCIRHRDEYSYDYDKDGEPGW
ncbi:hypothetical protein [Streptomyces longhuiensis]|uniref:hypothetical protein n=1 Tax=Streptomyces TaxID=1883 RepID=UPI001D0B6A8D|nr:hypothetical protein [Streptomyces longhuiensis]UDM00230.1 hypothetical protein LGI35_19055 [Streptomyces longhuiensis]